jgi:hypothetical protein
MARPVGSRSLPVSTTRLTGSWLIERMCARVAGAPLASAHELVLACMLTPPALILNERGRRPCSGRATWASN